MRKLLYAAVFTLICAGVLVVARGSQAASDEAVKAPAPAEISGVWKGYLYPQVGAQVRVYAVFVASENGLAVKLLTPSSPWVEDSQALCILAEAAECSKAVTFSEVSGLLPLTQAQGAYASAETPSGELIKISGDAQKLRFSLKKGGLAGSVQEFTGVLDTHLKA